MKNRFFSSLVACLMFFSANLFAFAEDIIIDDLHFSAPTIRLAPPGAPVSAGYLTISNHGDQTDRLLSISVDFAEKSEIHEMKMEGDIMKMRPLSEGILIEPGQTITLEPGGLHFMFMKVKEPLRERASKKAVLQFEKAGQIELDFIVQNVARKKMDHSTHKMPKSH